MKNHLIILLMFFISSCGGEKNNCSSKQFVGRYKLHYPVNSSGENAPDFYIEEIATETYIQNNLDIVNSEIYIRENGSFQVTNRLLTDSTGTWTIDYIDDFGCFLNLRFTQGDIGRLLFSRNDYRVLEVGGQNLLNYQDSIYPEFSEPADADFTFVFKKREKN